MQMEHEKCLEIIFYLNAQIESIQIQLNPARADPRRTEFRLEQMGIQSPNFFLFDFML